MTAAGWGIWRSKPGHQAGWTTNPMGDRIETTDERARHLARSFQNELPDASPVTYTARQLSEAIAAWHSRGDRWIARLDRGDAGYSLRSFKAGAEVGCSFRPVSIIATDEAAIEWATNDVRACFDVRMSRAF